MKTKESNVNTGISRKKAAQERKSAAKNERDKLYYQKNKEKKITQVKEWRKQMRSKKSTRPLTRQVAKKSERREASRIAAQERRKKIRKQTRERVRKYREKKQTAAQEDRVDSPGFANRMSKKRVTDKVKKSLPSTPRKKAEIVQTIVKSPQTRKILSESGLIKTPGEQKETETLRALASDISEGLNEVKRSGSREKRAAFKVFKSLAFGEKVKKAKAKKSVAKLVNLGEKSISRAIQHREKNF